MKHSFRGLVLSLSLLAGSLASARAHAGPRPDLNAYLLASRPANAATARLASVRGRAARAGGVVTAIDEQRGVPTFLWATRVAPPTRAAGLSPEAAARHYLGHFADVYGLSSAALGSAHVVHVHDIGQGPVVVTLRQRVDGAELFQNEVKVLLRQNLDLVAIAGNLHPAAVPRKTTAGRGAFRLAPNEALLRAIEDLHGIHAAPSSLVETRLADGGYRLFELAPGGALAAANLHLSGPARVKKVHFPMPEILVPAYFVELVSGDARSVSSDAYEYVIAADDGRILYRRSLIDNDAFNYRVWAETTGDRRPLDGPQVDYTPHPTGAPDGTEPDFIPAPLVSMEGFNTNPDGAVDPWLPAGATQTVGNNVDAYADHHHPDGFSEGDIRATITAERTFDHVYDTSRDPLSSESQIMAAVTQMFYVTNWLHDWYYDSGFDEAAGNAQQDNKGRGGLDGDPLLAEAQDGARTPQSPRNNANMLVPADGASPRMQMYLWTTPDVRRTLTIQPGGARLDTGTATFGPSHFEISGEVVLVDDGVDSTPDDAVDGTRDGCEAPLNDVAGKIVLVDRGGCTYKQKVVNAEAAGALGVLLANHVPGDAAPTMANGAPADVVVNIPTLSISFEEGNRIKAALLDGPVTAEMERVAGVLRDSALDNTAVAHEWGHYLHRRLTRCGTKQCSALSEGWADFIALHMAIREGDDLDGTFATVIYAAQGMGDSGYRGARRAPYTVDFDKNALTFRHIADGEELPAHPMGVGGGQRNSEVHNAGEIWTLMLFEGYVALLRREEDGRRVYTHDEARRLMSDLIVAGMKLAPVDATFTEQRDALLAAAAARSEADMLALAGGFARRGAGTCAASAPRASVDFVGVVESFALKPLSAVVVGQPVDDVRSCDGDGFLDAGERGTVTFEVHNAGPMPLVGAEATVTSTNPHVSFPNGATLAVPEVPPFGAVTVAFDVLVDDAVAGRSALELRVEVATPDACEPTVAAVTGAHLNVDDVPRASAVDSVESEATAWTKEGDEAEAVWSREKTGPVNHAWRGVDHPSLSDTQLVSPPLPVSADEPLVIRFKHRHSFEITPAGEAPEAIHWDGGVIEISDDDGATWQDIAAYADPGYGGPIGNIPDEASVNPLAGRQGFVGVNAAWPEPEQVTLDLGTAFSGKTVRIRFRIGTDAYVGDFGWEIDDIEVHGLLDTPFGALAPDTSGCDKPRTGEGGSGAGEGGAVGEGGTGEGGADAPAEGAAPPADDDGCGCEVAGGPASPAAGSLASLLAVAALGLRRRRGGRRGTRERTAPGDASRASVTARAARRRSASPPRRPARPAPRTTAGRTARRPRRRSPCPA